MKKEEVGGPPQQQAAITKNKQSKIEAKEEEKRKHRHNNQKEKKKKSNIPRIKSHNMGNSGSTWDDVKQACGKLDCRKCRRKPFDYRSEMAGNTGGAGGGGGGFPGDNKDGEDKKGKEGDEKNKPPPVQLDDDVPLVSQYGSLYIVFEFLLCTLAFALAGRSKHDISLNPFLLLLDYICSYFFHFLSWNACYFFW